MARVSEVLLEQSNGVSSVAGPELVRRVIHFEMPPVEDSVRLCFVALKVVEVRIASISFFRLERRPGWQRVRIETMPCARAAADQLLELLADATAMLKPGAVVVNDSAPRHARVENAVTFLPSRGAVIPS
jgi:hypothetical protein